MELGFGRFGTLRNRESVAISAFSVLNLLLHFLLGVGIISYRERFVFVYSFRV